MYAAGKIPGSFFRREGRPSTEAILACRLIDRPLRPLFVKGLRNEVQVVITVLSIHPDDSYDVLAINAASMSTQLSGLPFSGPIGGVRVALIDGQWVAFPRYSELRARRRSTWSSPAASSSDGDVAIMMVEAEATENSWNLIKFEGGTAPTEEIVSAGHRGRQAVHQGPRAQAQQRAGGEGRQGDPGLPDCSRTTRTTPTPPSRPPRTQSLSDALSIADKQYAREPPRRDQGRGRSANLAAQFEGREKELSAAYRSVQKKLIRQRILTDGFRIDGRGLRDIRTLSAEVEVLPRVHGSAMFERGETQILGVTTLNMLRMEQQLDTLSPETRKRYMHNYNFPPYSTGETGRVGSPEASRDRPRRARRARAHAGPAQPRGVPLRDPPGLRGAELQRLDLDGLGLRLDPVAAQRRCAAARAGRGHRDGPRLRHGERGDPLRGAHRHPRGRGRVRRHGLQGRRHPRVRHGHPARHQARGHPRLGAGRRADPGQGGSPARSSTSWPRRSTCPTR